MSKIRPAILVGSKHDADEIKKCGLGEYDIIDISTDHPELVPDKRYLCYGKDSFSIINGKGVINLGDKKNPRIVEGYGIHFGLRGDENFHCCTKIPYLKTSQGYIFKFSYLDYRRSDPTWLNEQSYNAMLKNYENLKLTMKDLELKKGISKKNGKPWYMMTYKTIHLGDDIKSYLADENYLTNPPEISYYKIVREESDIIKSLTYFTDLEVGTYIGLDYETHGEGGHAIPFDDHQFRFMGVALATTAGIAAYFDMEYYFREGNEHLLDVFKKYYRKFLDKHGNYCITYNVSFELRCTYLLLNKMYKFQDASTLNKLEGAVEKNYTLKFTAQKYLPGIGSWDDEFDHFQSLFWSLFKLGKSNYLSSPEWNAIVEYSKNPSINANLSEINLLISKYWNDPFGCIPAEVLGKYCCKDAFHTALIRECSDKLGYSTLAWETFDANLRMAAWLHINGQYIDYKLNRDWSKKAKWITAYGKLNVSLAYTTWIRDRMNIPLIDLPESMIRVLSLGKNPFNSKNFIRSYYIELPGDTNLCLNKDKLVDDFKSAANFIIDRLDGHDFKKLSRSRKIWSQIDQYLVESWGIDEKSIGNIQDIIKYYKLSYDKEKLKGLLSKMKFKDPKDFIIYQGQTYKVDQLMCYADSIINTNSSDTKLILAKLILGDLMNIVSECYVHPEVFKDHLLNGGLSNTDWDYDYESILPDIIAGGPIKIPNNYLFQEYLDCIDVINKLKELVESGGNVIKDCLKNNQSNASQGDYNEDEDESSNEQNEQSEEKSSSKKEILDYDQLIDKLYKIGPDYNPLQFIIETNYTLRLIKDHQDTIIKLRRKSTPISIADQAAHMLSYSLSYKSGFIFHNMFRNWFFPRCYTHNPETRDIYYSIFDELDPAEKSVRGLSKFATSYRMAKKYMKSISYLDGMFIDGIRMTGELDENDWITEKWSHKTMDPNCDELGHIYTKFNCAEKKSGRWSAALHTIQAKGTAAEIKRCMVSPKGHLMSYFDISGMEVRGVAYDAEDKFMIKAYETPRDEWEEFLVKKTGQYWRIKGEDPYIMMNKVLEPGKDKSYYKRNRNTFKSVLLGNLYGKGIPSLAGELNVTIEEARKVYEDMFNLIPDISNYIKRKSSYPNDPDKEGHYGYVETMLGNKLSILNESKDRWSRLGINLCVQGGSSLKSCMGFENSVIQSMNGSVAPKGSLAPEGSEWNLNIRPFNVVHDSMQANWNADGLFRIQEFYAMNYQRFLIDNHKVNFAFDLEVGPDYFNLANLHTIEYDKVVDIIGSKVAIDGILTALGDANCKYHIESAVDKSGNSVLLPDGTLDESKYTSNIPDILEGFIEYDDVYYAEDSSNYTFRLVKD